MNYLIITVDYDDEKITHINLEKDKLLKEI